MNDDVAEFVAHLLHSATVAHFMHWATSSRSDHQALGDYYEEIIEKVDKFAESYMGRYERLKKFPDDFHSATDPDKYFESLKSFVEEARKHLPQDSELQNRVDDIAELINTTLYQLKDLD